LANPQWTPFEETAPAWMKTGFQLFKMLSIAIPVYEVFPTASYSLLEGVDDVSDKYQFQGFSQRSERYARLRLSLL
jgi:predicted nuclease with RNAse H fold